jgi:hypothetical protein
MKSSAISGIALAAVMLAACGGNGNGATVPGAGSGLRGVSSRTGDTTGPNLSGEYSGPADDNVWGKGTGAMFYAQSANAVGGSFDLKLAKNSLYLSSALTVKGSTVDGTNESGSGNQYCTSLTKATYDEKTNVLSGSYTASYGCAYKNEKGTFALKHRCYFKSGDSADVRPEGAVKAC